MSILKTCAVLVLLISFPTRPASAEELVLPCAEGEPDPARVALEGLLPGNGWQSRVGSAVPASELIGSLTGYFENLWVAFDGDPSQMGSFWMSGPQTFVSLQPIPVQTCGSLGVSDRGFSTVQTLRYRFASAEAAAEALKVRVDGGKKSKVIAPRIDPGKSNIPLTVIRQVSKFGKATDAGMAEAWRLVGDNGARRIEEYWARQGPWLGAAMSKDLHLSAADASAALGVLVAEGP